MRSRDRLCLIVIVLLALAVYANALGSAFIPDDDDVLLKNEWIRQGGSLRKLLPPAYFEVSGEGTGYRPTATLLYYVEYRLWGTWRAGYHWVSIGIHAGAAALLYLLVYRLFGRGTLAFLTALLFALHPVTTEAVNGIGYREDPLCLLYMLAAWLCHLAADMGDKRRPWLWPAAWLFYAIALLAKATAAGLPVLILAYDGFSRDRGAGDRPGRRWPAYLGFVLLMLAYVPFRLSWGRTAVEAGLPYTTGSSGAQMMITPGILAHYLRLLLWPVGLSFDYWFGFVTGPQDPRFWAPILALAVPLFLVLRTGRRAPAIILGALWALVTLAPAANIFPMPNPMAERYLYVPAAGFCLCLAVPLAGLIRGAARSRGAGLALACAVLAAFGVLTVARNADWRHGHRLDCGAVRRWPGAARSHMNLGVDYFRGGFKALARTQYLRVIAMAPYAPQPHQFLAELELSEGRVAAAMRAVTRAMRCDPERGDT